MALGSPVTNKFSIGTAELRIGPLTSANKLLQTHSVGLIDSATLNVEQEAAELEGGFPKKLVDTAIIRQSASITANLREYSRRNIMTMLGNGVVASVTDVSTTIATTDPAAAATSLTVASATGITVDSIISIYKLGAPEQVTIVKVTGVTGAVLTLEYGLLYDYDIGDPVFVAAPVAVGAVSQTNYFSVMLVQKENSTGRPVVWSFWKGAIASGLSLETSAEDFASTDMEIKLLEPAASEYASGKDLFHLASIIPTHPVGLYAGGGDI